MTEEIAPRETFEEMRSRLDSSPVAKRLEVVWPETPQPLDMMFFPAKNKGRIIPTSSIQYIDVETEEGKEHLIFIATNTGSVSIKGDNLEALAHLIYTRKIAKVTTGEQESGGFVELITLLPEVVTI